MTLRTHSRAYLESLLHPPISSGAIGSRPTALTRTASGIGLSINDANNYKPTKSSGLAVGNNEKIKRASDEDEEEEEQEDNEMNAVLSRAISLDRVSWEDEEYDPSMLLHVHTLSTRSSLSSSSASQSVHVILNLLDDEELDDEERIERVRFTLAARLSEIEGGPVSAARLDNIVLSLLHRHREDIRPTGASFALPASPSPSPFPASPRSRPRPANLRSMSGTNAALSRPWTPNLPLTPTSATFNHDSGPSVPSSPMLIPQALSSIGNGSPRASPSLWHRSLSNSTSLAATSNPWSASSPISVPSPFFAPLGPPGDTIGSPPKSLTSNTSGSLLGTSVATLSRPSSPSNAIIDSPKLNVAALEFKPRSASHQVVTPQKPAPWLADDNDLIGIKASEDSDEDEFSPFAGQGLAAISFPDSSSSSSASSSRLATGRSGRPISGASGHSSFQSLTTGDSISGSYHGSTTSTSLESSDNQRGTTRWANSALEDDKEVTPFDILSSILSSSQLGASTWTSDQLKEALEVNNYDVDSTLTSIMRFGGISPGTIITKSKSPALLNRSVSTGLTIVSPSPRGGVSLASRDSFTSQRGGDGAITPGIAASPVSTTTQASQQILQGGAGGVGPGRVCRYFLAGECRRADCRFSHDLNRAICRFWIKGQCLNGEGCSFLHDMSIIDKLTNRLSTQNSNLTNTTTTTSTSSAAAAGSTGGEREETSIKDEFPELLTAPTGPKAQRIKVMPSSSSSTAGAAAAAHVNDRSRWAHQGSGKRNNN